MPKVERRGRSGRPRFEISEDVLLELRSYGFTWKQVADMLLVSRWSIRRRVVEYGLQETTRFSALSDEQIYIKQVTEAHGNIVGCSIVQGFLKSLAFRLQRCRIRITLASEGKLSFQDEPIQCKGRTGFLIHGGIDGFSRLIVYLHCSNNNRKEPITHLFRSATERYDWPSRVRSDGGENVGVWQLEEEVRSPNRGSFLAGAPVHNQCIKLNRTKFTKQASLVGCILFCVIFFVTHLRPWMSQDYSHETTNKSGFSVTCCCVEPSSYENGAPLVSISDVDKWRLMLDISNHSQVGISDITESKGDVDDLQLYGYDPFAPTPSNDGLSVVEVKDINIDLPNDTLTLLKQNIDLLQHSDSFGINLFQNGLLLLVQAGEQKSISQ
ncbi:hypothetical protein pdam_00004572, partial [Pocillopora damicornis]